MEDELSMGDELALEAIISVEQEGNQAVLVYCLLLLLDPPKLLYKEVDEELVHFGVGAKDVCYQ